MGFLKLTVGIEFCAWGRSSHRFDLTRLGSKCNFFISFVIDIFVHILRNAHG
ncbi:MAG: hypothetical protein ACFE8N_03990 [Promethearchaeota archaeon]